MRRLALGIVLTLAACVVAPTSQPPTSLGIRNDTSVALTVVVNGTQVAAIGPGEVQSSVDAASLPPLPWTVKAQAPSGLALGTMLTGPYQANDIESAVFALACGTITIWTGASAPPSPLDLPAEASALPPPTCGP